MLILIKNLIKRGLIKILPNLSSTFPVNDVKLTVNRWDRGGLNYRSDKSFKELNSKFFNVLRGSFKPERILDIGANYGFTAIIMKKNFPYSKLVLVEADKKLGPYLKNNLSQNDITDFHLFEAICGDGNDKELSFSLNPGRSQDNRVTGEKGWGTVSVPSTSIDDILPENADDIATFIKVDTQGYERQVILGGTRYLQTSKMWIMKMEFAPEWLRKQGTEPDKFLLELIEKYNVFEYPERVPFHFSSLIDFNDYQITNVAVQDFINFVEGQNKDSRGWVDLIILPKSFILN